MTTQLVNVNICSEYKYNKRDITMTFRNIKEFNILGNLELNPDYQRDVVWCNEKMMSFIESIIHGFYYPPIILNLVDGKYICIDGKQRITSVLEFLNNNIYYTINDNIIYYNNFDNHSKETFLCKQFQACLYEDLEYEVEIEIFRRVQKGEPMTKMELMKSYNPDLICNLINKLEKYNLIWKAYNIKITRDNHLNYVLRALMMSYKNDFVTLTIPAIEKFVKDYDKIQNETLEESFYNNIDKLFTFLSEHDKELCKNNFLTILEFIMLFKLILDNELQIYTKKFFIFREFREGSITTYIPKVLNKTYQDLKNV